MQSASHANCAGGTRARVFAAKMANTFAGDDTPSKLLEMTRGIGGTGNLAKARSFGGRSGLWDGPRLASPMSSEWWSTKRTVSSVRTHTHMPSSECF